jgi:hypothetical protein
MYETHELDILKQRTARLRDDVAKSRSVVEKSRDRARYAVGAIVLENPELYERVRPDVEPLLAKLASSTRKAVDDYSLTLEKLEELKKLAP